MTNQYDLTRVTCLSTVDDMAYLDKPYGINRGSSQLVNSIITVV